PASIRARLKNHADVTGQEFHLILTRYGLERLMFRLSQSAHAPNFLLKGALVFGLWFDLPHRPTRDADLLGFGDDSPQAIAAIFRELCALACPDGLDFDISSVQARESRLNKNYGGVHVGLCASLASARIDLRVDIGFGDVVTPPVTHSVEFPVLLADLPAPRLRVYPRETVFAEKLEAIASIGMTNSRMKDYFDLLALARENAMNPRDLAQAIGATFARRRTALPDDLPVGLTQRFATDAEKRKQWQAFLNRNRLAAPALGDVVAELATFSRTPLARAAAMRSGD
ncbi:MAG: nucleotidyl transferase AbiEii/AbiGii toxin family protein, partial [Xanthomonadales bacterium]|nr:nucleotidyl transferase AbiEii/AbiGii toxin family protein [Xanthomonadales bacterium]